MYSMFYKSIQKRSSRQQNIPRFCKMTELRIAEMLLNFFAIQTSNCSSSVNVCFRIIPFLVAVILNVGSAYSSYILISTGLEEGLGDKTWLMSVLRCIISFSLWWIVFTRRKRLLKHLNKLRKWSNHVSSLKCATIISISGISLTVIFPISYVIFWYNCDYIVNEQTGYSSFWLMGYSFENHLNVKKYVLCVCYFVYYLSQFIFPNVLSLIYCVLTWNTSKLVVNIKIPIEMAEGNVILECLRKRRILKESAKELESNYTFSVFCLIVYHIASIFSAGTVVLGHTNMPGTIATFEMSIVFSVSIVCFIGMVLCASKVPASFDVLNGHLRMLHQNVLADDIPAHKIEMKYSMLLQSVIEEREFYLTVWGFLNINKSMIFSAFGGLLTYGILADKFK